MFQGPISYCQAILFTFTINIRQPGNYPICFQTDADDAFHKVVDIGRVVVFSAPVVGVVTNAAVLIYGDGIAFHDPVQCAFTIHNVVIGVQRNALEGDVAVVDDGSLFTLFGETHGSTCS